MKLFGSGMTIFDFFFLSAAYCTWVQVVQLLGIPAAAKNLSQGAPAHFPLPLIRLNRGTRGP